MYKPAQPYTPSQSPYQLSQPYPQQQPNPQGPGQIVPGSITYTTSTAPDGTVTYHPFRAVPASYQTPSGLVSGIQWISIEPTQVLPTGAQPAGVDFVGAWNRGKVSPEDQKAIMEWQVSAEEKRRRKEEQGSKAIRDRSQSRSRGEPDAELRRARERDAMIRERRKSMNQGQPPFPSSPAGIPPTQATAYQAQPYQPYNPPVSYPASYNNIPPSDARYPSGPVGNAGLADLNRQFAELDFDRGLGERGRERKLSRPSKYNKPEPVIERGRRYSSAAENQPTNLTQSYPQLGQSYPGPGISSNASYAASANAEAPFIPPPVGPTGANYARSTSPNQYPPYPTATSYRSHSRAASPSLGGLGPSAPFVGPQTGYVPSAMSGVQHVEMQQQLVAPEGFSRPVNPGLPYTPFETTKIQDMDDFLETRPLMPSVLKLHDVFAEDWSRLIQDITLAWSGRLPVPHLSENGQPPKRASLTANLIDLWNVSFFMRRGVEVILYKGRERRSGQQAGMVDLPQHLFGVGSVSSSSSDSEDASDASPENENAYGFYGRPTFAPGMGSMADVLERRRIRRNAREEKKRRRLENKIRQKEKAKEKKYSLYISCVRSNQARSLTNVGLGGY